MFESGRAVVQTYAVTDAFMLWVQITWPEIPNCIIGSHCNLNGIRHNFVNCRKRRFAWEVRLWYLPGHFQITFCTITSTIKICSSSTRHFNQEISFPVHMCMFKLLFYCLDVLPFATELLGLYYRVISKICIHNVLYLIAVVFNLCN